MRLPPTGTERPVYDELIKPNEHRIVFYPLHKKTPDVVPTNSLGATPYPRGMELSRQAVVASSAKPKSTQVLINIPAPQLEVQKDLPLPLLVMKLQTEPLPTSVPLKPLKKFVPPAASRREPALPTHTAVIETPTPALPSPVATPTIPGESFSVGTIPKKAPEAPTPQAGNARADVAIASLHPKESTDTLVPEGARTGKFSKAPAVGEPASGDVKDSALTVPDLTIRNPKPAHPPPVAVEEIFYRERVRSVPMSTLSVPLRPSSRMIPPSVGAQFKGRNVYTIVLPMEHITAYSGDWILWFADRVSTTGETPVVRAPVPYRKLEPIEQAPPASRTKERIQFSATLGKDGKLAAIALLTKITAALQRAVFADLDSWEFRPATRDGVAVDVDVVLEIPFSLPAPVATGVAVN